MTSCGLRSMTQLIRSRAPSAAPENYPAQTLSDQFANPATVLCRIGLWGKLHLAICWFYGEPGLTDLSKRPTTILVHVRPKCLLKGVASKWFAAENLAPT